MEENLNKSYLEEVRSDEVQEIVSRIPPWIVRWGSLLMFIIFLVFFYISWFVRYPDVIRANVVVTTFPAPINLFTRTDGRLRIIKKDNEMVQADEPIAYIEGDFVLTDIEQLEKIITKEISAISIEKLQNLKVGNLQSSLSNFESALLDFRLFEENKAHIRQINQLKRQKSSMQEIGANQFSQLNLLRRELIFAFEKFSTDSVLYAQKVISSLDFNTAKVNYLQQQRSLKASEKMQLENKLGMAQIDKQIEDLYLLGSSNGSQLTVQLQNRLNELRAALRKWKEEYLIISPMAGRLSYLIFLHDKIYVQSGKPLISIIPTTQEVFGQAELPVHRAGQVRRGQTVNIKLQNYPSEKYGMLTGYVESVSLISNEDKYLVSISLPKHLTTTYNIDLDVKGDLKGETEIITEDLRLLERIFYQFRKLITAV